MKKYIIRIEKYQTIVTNIKDPDTVYRFDGVAKIIVDNIGVNENLILQRIKNQFNNITFNQLKIDYKKFINQLNELEITKSNIEKIIITNSDEHLKYATIEILNSCSFKCNHCYISKNKKFIKFEIYKDIINQLVELNCNEILLTGGEPMLHKNFIEMYLYAKSRGFLVSINSNLYLLNDDILDVLCQYKPRQIEISLYGFDDNSYSNFTHVNDAYEKVNQNINKLLSNNINIEFKSVLTKNNKDYIYEIKKYADNFNIPFRFDYIIFPNKDAIINNFERCSSDEIVEILKKDEDIKNFFESKVKSINKNISNNNHIFQCSIGKDRIFIDSNLNLRPCLVVPFEYNIMTHNINEAYNFFKKISKNYEYSEINKCKNCYKKSICRYCPGKFYMETGSFEKAPNFYCDLADKIIKEFS